MKGDKITFKGAVIKNVFDRERFKIYSVKVDALEYPDVSLNQFGDVSILGDLPQLQVHGIYEITGVEDEGKYGAQYKVEDIRRDLPSSTDEVAEFLRCVVTENQAAVMAEHYPDIVDRVRENRLSDIDVSNLYGIGEKTLAKIIDNIRKDLSVFDFAAELGDIFSMSELHRLANIYTSVDVVKERLMTEPYSMLTSLSGIGFVKADEKVLKMQDTGRFDFGYDVKTSKDRCLACVKYLLQENEKDGNTKMNLAELRAKVFNLTPACCDKFPEAIMDNSIYYSKDDMDISFARTHRVEKFIAGIIFHNIYNDNVWSCDSEKYRSVGEFDLSDEQLSVLDNVCRYNINILNGAGGSGKSQSVKSLISMLDDKKKSYMLMAPTGKAARVLSEFTCRHATTIHKGLDFDSETGRWFYNEENKFKSDIIIVDEMSMTDIYLFSSLIRAIDFDRTKLLMIGDNAQLPSVGCGNLLHDFMHSGIIPTITLSKIFRYADGGLLKVATDMRLGRCYLNKSMKGKITKFGTNQDYAFIDTPDDKVIERAVALYKKLLGEGNSFDDIQLITAKNVGKYGTIVLNKALQRIANKNYGSSSFVKCGDTTYYIGDLVIARANNYHSSYFVANGDTGIIKKFVDGGIIISFNGNDVKYNKKQLDSISLGYAITAHKSQGTSVNNVVFLTPKADTFMLNSNLVYVGCTRAKKMCYHIGNVDTVNTVVKKKANFTRHTFMQQLLKDMADGYNQ